MIRERHGKGLSSLRSQDDGLETGLVACHGFPMHHSHIHNSGGGGGAVKGEEIYSERTTWGNFRCAVMRGTLKSPGLMRGTDL